MRLPCLLPLVAACVEYDLGQPVVPVETDAPDTEVIDTDVIDTSAPSCEVELAPPVSDIQPACDGGEPPDPPEDPWQAAILWRWTPSGMYTTPTVGDLDGNGIPSVVAMAGPYFTSSGSLAVLDGRTGAEEWRIDGDFDGMSGTALGDVDGDGDGDVIASHGTWASVHVISAYDGTTGTELWSTTIGVGGETFPAIADLDGDGTVEIVINEYILDGTTGAILGTLDGVAYPANWGAPAIADLDLDGDQEILLTSKVFDSDGTYLWSCGSNVGDGTFPHPVNADADAEAEVLITAAYRITLCDDDGTTLWTRTTTGYYGSASAIADFDGDGMQEYAIAANNEMLLVEADSTVRWTAPITDSSGLAGSTSWDVDLDGRPEVIFADETDILVIDGQTGEIVIRFPEHASPTLAETPSVADVDGDGSGELLYTSAGGYFDGLTVIGGAQEDWPYARPTYNQYGFSGTNVGDDLSIPANPTPSWLDEAMVFRGQPSGVYNLERADLVLAITDVCATGCASDDYVAVAIQVWNAGADVVPAGAGVEVYGATGVVATAVIDLELPPGASWEGSLSTTAGALGSLLGARVEHPGPECTFGDNAQDYAAWACP